MIVHHFYWLPWSADYLWPLKWKWIVFIWFTFHFITLGQNLKTSKHQNQVRNTFTTKHKSLPKDEIIIFTLYVIPVFSVSKNSRSNKHCTGVLLTLFVKYGFGEKWNSSTKPWKAVANHSHYIFTTFSIFLHLLQVWYSRYGYTVP